MRIKSYLIFIVFISVAAIYSCGKKLAPSKTGISREYDSVKFDYFFIEAIKYKDLGNNGDALRLFEQCLKIDPESGASYYQMAQIVMANGDTERGKQYLRKAIEYEPGNLWYLLMLANSYYQENKLDSSIIYYEKAVSYNPGREEMKMTLANLYSENKKYEKAELIFKSLESKYGINQTSTVGSIRNLMAAGNYDDAMGKTESLLKKYPDEILYNGLLAEIYRGKGDQEKAMEVYNKMLDRHPDNPETQLSICDFLLKEKRYKELFILLNTVILNDSVPREDKLSLFSRMISTKELVKQEKDNLLLAMMILEAKFKDDQIVQLLRPDLLSQEKKYNEAAARLEEIIKEQPENYYAWEKLLLVYLDAHESKKLEEKGRECATKFNRSFLAKILYATGASENGNYDKALEELRKADILAGNDNEMKMQVLSIKADVLYKKKDFENAYKTFDEALKINNNDITILNNYAYYLAEQNTRIREAEEMSKKAIEAEPENKTFLDTYGWILYKRGKLKEAEKIFEGIIDMDEESDAEYFEHYGYILKKSKDCKNAVLNWKSALKLDSTKVYLIKEIENCRNTH
jgi:tetratricopeptide (TPR) repeat protein